MFSQIRRLGIPREEISDVTSDANSLVVAGQQTLRGRNVRMLVDWGQETTVVSVLLQGQPVFTSSFPQGGARLTAAIAAEGRCSEADAERTKCTSALLAGPAASKGAQSAVDRWLAELERTWRDCVAGHPALAGTQSPEVVLCGGASALRGVRMGANALRRTFLVARRRGLKRKKRRPIRHEDRPDESQGERPRIRTRVADPA